jgi:hypothetical protein
MIYVICIAILVWALTLPKHKHKGWVATHRSGYEIRCTGCGEERSLMMGWVTPSVPDWWETSNTGDGSCGPIPELPRRWEFY